MKNLLFVTAILALCLLLIACDGESVPALNQNGDGDTSSVITESTGTDTQKETENTPTEPTAYTLTLDNGVTVTLGGTAADALSVLGEYTDVMEAPNCINPGYDRVYTYGSSYKLTTSPATDGAEYVSQIELLSDLVAWEINGTALMIGSSASEVEAALGTPSEDTFGVRKYTLNGAVVTVIIEDGLVTGLTVACS